MDVSRPEARIRENADWSQLAQDSGVPASDRVVAWAEAELAAVRNPVEPDPHDVDRNRFIAMTYESVLGRPASPAEIMRHARRLRFLPFLYTRRRFLDRLRNSREALDYRTRDWTRHDAEMQVRLKLIEHRQEQVRLQLKALLSAVTELGGEIVADLRHASAGDGRLSKERPPCAS